MVKKKNNKNRKKIPVKKKTTKEYAPLSSHTPKLDPKILEESKKVSSLLEEQFGRVADNILKLASKFMEIKAMDLDSYLNIAVKAWNYCIYREAGISSSKGNELVIELKRTINSKALLDNIFKEKLKIAKWDSRLVIAYSFDDEKNAFSVKSNHEKTVLDGIKNLREKEESQIIKYQKIIFQSESFDFNEKHLEDLYNLYDTNPYNPLVTIMLAEMLSKSYNVNIEESIKHYEEAANIMKDDIYPHIRVMECYKKLNMDEKAEEKYVFIKEFVEKYPDEANLKSFGEIQ